MESRQHRLQGLLRLAWTVQAHFPNFDLVPELDWEVAVAAAVPAIAAARTTVAYYDRLQQLLAQLHDGHTYVSLPAQFLRRLARPAIELGWVEHQPTVLRTSPDTPGAALGLGT